MAVFTFDTSGVVTIPSGPYAGDWTWERVGQESGLFTQGYIEALFAQGPKGSCWRTELSRVAIDRVRSLAPRDRIVGFSDLAPETLARIIADCAAHQSGPRPWVNIAVAGAAWWADRQNGHWTDEVGPPLAPYLGDDGKVYLREGA